jgi:hypothetical protein
VFSETRYALNGDLRVAYRTSREGTRDIAFVPYWFTCCEILPELPSIQGWVEAMTSSATVPSSNVLCQISHSQRSAPGGGAVQDHRPPVKATPYGEG